MLSVGGIATGGDFEIAQVVESPGRCAYQSGIAGITRHAGTGFIDGQSLAADYPAAGLEIHSPASHGE
ncbi:MAG: hypothetical protein ACKVT0_18135 [Planctomycetaceae bacterium]